jgi:serine/threonine-protein kinase
MFLRTTGTGPVTATAAWSVAGRTVRTQRIPLDGSRFYTRPLRYSMAERPCGKTVSVTVVTVPAAPGGPQTAATSVPPCPTEVTGLRVALDVAAEPGRTATARVRVTTSGRDAVPVEARFAQNHETLATRTATLAGHTFYSRTFDHTFRTRPCGDTLSVTVRAGDRTATATARVTCPPHVLRVAIGRAAIGRDGASANVTVTTANVQPVRLSVSFYLGGRLMNTQTIPLSDETSYGRSVRHSFGKMPCGTSWSVVATTRPRPDSGAARAGGTTAACTEDPKPDDQQTDEPDDHDSAPPKTDDQSGTDQPQTDDPESEQPSTGSAG